MLQSPDRKRIAVLGCDSFIGACTFNLLLEKGWDCIGTTRRPENVRENVIYLNLANSSSWRELLSLEPDAAVAFFAISKLDECERNPMSRQINVHSIPDLLSELALQGSRTLFLSTNAVFGGDRELCNELEPTEPRITYARQKCDAENRIRQLAEKEGWTQRSAIIRISRTIGADTPPFETWIRQLKAGFDIEAFEDFVFAPISLVYASQSILTIALSGSAGIFHISGRDLSYYRFAMILADKLGSSAKIHATSSAEKGVNLLFRPRYSALAMERTTDLLGIRPQDPEHVVADLLQTRRPGPSGKAI